MSTEGETEREKERERERGRPSIGKNVKATFSPIVARNRLLALRAETIARISVLFGFHSRCKHSARPGASQGRPTKDYYFCAQRAIGIVNVRLSST